MDPIYLQTVEAYREYLSRLTDDGILQINYYVYPRMITTAAQAWHDLFPDRDFARHVIIEGSGWSEFMMPTMLIKRSPWTLEEIAAVRRFVSPRVRGGARPHLRARLHPRPARSRERAGRVLPRPARSRPRGAPALSGDAHHRRTAVLSRPAQAPPPDRARRGRLRAGQHRGLHQREPDGPDSPRSHPPLSPRRALGRDVGPLPLVPAPLDAPPRARPDGRAAHRGVLRLPRGRLHRGRGRADLEVRGADRLPDLRDGRGALHPAHRGRCGQPPLRLAVAPTSRAGRSGSSRRWRS